MSEASSRRSERRSRQHAANRGSILAAARRVAERRGTADLSLRAAAAEAGYAPATVYAYFRNRAELVLALAADELGALARTMRDAPDRTAAANAAFALMRGSASVAAAVSTLESGDVPAEAERHFNGKLIAALTALAASPTPTRDEQMDVVLMAAALSGLVFVGAHWALKALGLDERNCWHAWAGALAHELNSSVRCDRRGVARRVAVTSESRLLAAWLFDHRRIVRRMTGLLCTQQAPISEGGGAPFVHHTWRPSMRAISGMPAMERLASLAHSRKAVRHASNGLALNRCSDAGTGTKRVRAPTRDRNINGAGLALSASCAL